LLIPSKFKFGKKLTSLGARCVTIAKVVFIQPVEVFSMTVFAVTRWCETELKLD